MTNEIDIGSITNKEESIYRKYNLSIDGKKTFVYALKSLTVEEAKKELKNRFKDSKVTGIKSE